MAVIYNNAEGGTNGVTVTVDNSAGASGHNWDSVSLGTNSAITYASSPARGTLSYKFSLGPTADSASIVWSINYATFFLKAVTTAYARAYIYLPALPSGTPHVFGFQGSMAAVINSTGKLVVRDGAGTAAFTSSTVLPTNQWVRLEFKCTTNATTGQVEAMIFCDADSPYCSEKLTSTATFNTGASFTGGPIWGPTATNMANYTYYLDDMAVSDSGYLGPTNPIQSSTFTRANGAESGTDGTPVTENNSGNGNTSGDYFVKAIDSAPAEVTFSSEQKMHGNLSYKLVPSNGNRIELWWSNFSTTAAAIRFYMYFTSYPPSATEISQLMITPLTFGQLARFAITASGAVSILDNVGTIWTSTATLSLNTWYRFEMSAALGGTAATGTINAAFYSGDSLTALDSFTTNAANLGTASIAASRIGKLNANAWIDPMYVDDIAVVTGTTTFIGPYTTAPVQRPLPYSGIIPFSGWGTQL